MNKNLKQPKKETEKKKPSDLEMGYKRIFLSGEGKTVLESLKKNLKYGETVYHPNKSDRDNAFEQGRQSVINDIIFILNK